MDLSKPILTKIIIDYASSDKKDWHRGMMWMIIMVTLTTATSVISQHAEF